MSSLVKRKLFQVQIEPHFVLINLLKKTIIVTKKNSIYTRIHKMNATVVLKVTQEQLRIQSGDWGR